MKPTFLFKTTLFTEKMKLYLVFMTPSKESNSQILTKVRAYYLNAITERTLD